jgi:pyridoxamine 5'-phosphate oxidase
MPPSLADLRESYGRAGLLEADAGPDPIALFERWFGEARSAGVPEPNAMTLATVDDDGTPDARAVLLKEFDARGFVFFTNYGSRKAKDLARHPVAALCFAWLPLERQVRIRGTVAKVSREETETYFRTRPRGSQLGAWASEQSAVLDGRAMLEARLAELEEEYAGREVPVPPHWGGYRVSPASIEFWQGRPNRLHDRLRFVNESGTWRRERLSP